jgi:hypothetical protein
MDYRDTLTPWAIFRCSSNAQNVCINRFRSRRDADEYVRILRLGVPEGVVFEVVFDQATTSTSR